MSTHSMKIHPLVAAASAAVIVVSLVGTAALLDWLPGSHGDSDTPVVTAPMPSADKPSDAASNAAMNPTQSRTANASQAPSGPAYPAQAATPQHRYAPPPHAPAHPATAGAPPAAAPMPPVAQATPVCSSCGKVLAVRSVESEGKPSGVGVVAGAVVGGLLGNQVGGGTGRTLATVAGAVGGGYAGNEIEKRTRKAVDYEVDVRLETGERQTFRFDTQPGWKAGDRVKVVNGALVAR